MKFTIKIIVLLFSVNLYAQDYNLGLNQVILLELNTSGSTVPNGKIWKVTSAVSNAPTFSGISNNEFVGLHQELESYFLVNDAKSELHQLSWWYDYTIYGNNHIADFSSTFSSTTAFPMWLPEGTVLKSGQNVTHLSIIEFNIN